MTVSTRKGLAHVPLSTEYMSTKLFVEWDWREVETEICLWWKLLV